MGGICFGGAAPTPSSLAKPQGAVRYRFVDAGWLAGQPTRPLHVVFSRKGTARKILGLVTDAPALSGRRTHPDVRKTLGH